MNDLGYEPVSCAERATLAGEPDIGMSDVSKCLPDWIRSLSVDFEAGSGCVLDHAHVNSLLHTLIAARRRQHRLIRERDFAENMFNDTFGRVESALEEIGPVSNDRPRHFDPED